MPRIVLPDPPLTDGVVAVRAVRDSDLAAVVEACQDPEIPRWTRVPAPYTDADALAWRAHARAKQAAGELAWLAIADAGTDELIGSIGLNRVDVEERRADVGYWVAKHARGRGVATRAVRLVAGWAFESVGLLRLSLLAQPDNVASQRVAARAGFTREGLLRSYMEIKGERADFVVFSLLPGEL